MKSIDDQGLDGYIAHVASKARQVDSVYGQFKRKKTPRVAASYSKMYLDIIGRVDFISAKDAAEAMGVSRVRAASRLLELSNSGEIDYFHSTVRGGSKTPSKFYMAASTEGCKECGQSDYSKTGEHPCETCGIPKLHDEAQP